MLARVHSAWLLKPVLKDWELWLSRFRKVWQEQYDRAKLCRNWKITLMKFFFLTLAWIRLWVDISDLTAFSVLSLLLIIRCVDVCANYYNIARALVLLNILEATVIYISTVSTAAYFPSNSAERFQPFNIVFLAQSPIKINLLELKMKM